jgi:hypothetical protein
MNEVLKKYRGQLVKEGVIKASIYALLLAFTALAISALIFWMVDFKAVWVCAIIFVGVYFITTPIIYFARLRPSDKDIAKRIDKEFGLEERMLTMTELVGDDSYIANVQRQDAISSANKHSAKKIAVVAAAIVSVVGGSVGAIIGTTVAVTAGVGLTTVSILTAYDVIPSGKELLVAAQEEEPKYYTITYKFEGQGELLGETTQTVKEGENASSVWAVPSQDGYWYFTGWSDGYNAPYRIDKQVSKDMTVTATFESIENEDDDIETDSADDVPADLDLAGNNEDDDPDKKGGTPEDPPTEEEAGNNSDQTSSGGFYSYTSSYVIDGQTYYGGSVYENYYDEAMSELEDDDSIPDYIKEIIKKYYSNIKK